MRLTRVLFKKTAKRASKGQLRTPKDYQNPQRIQGVLTHTIGVELVPKVPKVTFGGGLENIYQGYGTVIVIRIFCITLSILNNLLFYTRSCSCDAGCIL